MNELVQYYIKYRKRKGDVGEKVNFILIEKYERVIDVVKP